MNIANRFEKGRNKGGFTGQANAHAVASSALQFSTLLEEGLKPHHKLLDVGGGCGRGAYWATRYLNEGNYFVIEPDSKQLEILKSDVSDPNKVVLSDGNKDFDFSVFNVKFDFFLVWSMWSHCPRTDIEKCLNGFAEHGTPEFKAIATYFPSEEEGYLGQKWVEDLGEKKPVVGNPRRRKRVFHNRSWMYQAIERRGFSYTVFDDLVINRRKCLIIKRRGL